MKSNFIDPLSKNKDQFSSIIHKINSVDSAVGIDAQLTHAIIIEYLEKISNQLDRLESKIKT